MYIDIGKQFSRFPAGRTPTDGQHNGESFREKFLKQNLKDGRHIKINLDGAISYGSSFLEEAFGGLVRIYNIQVSAIKTLISFETTDPFLSDEIWKYVSDAEKDGSQTA